MRLLHKTVQVARKTGYDDDPLLDILVVFDAPGNLDPERTVSMVRHIRPHLEAQGEEDFPILTSVSKKEAVREGLVAG